MRFPSNADEEQAPYNVRMHRLVLKQTPPELLEKNTHTRMPGIVSAAFVCSQVQVNGIRTINVIRNLNVALKKSLRDNGGMERTLPEISGYLAGYRRTRPIS